MKTNKRSPTKGFVQLTTLADLNLLDVRLLLPKLRLPDLGMADHTNHLAILLGAANLGGHRRALGALAGLAPALLVLGEGLLLRLVPGLVEATLHLPVHSTRRTPRSRRWVTRDTIHQTTRASPGY